MPRSGDLLVVGTTFCGRVPSKPIDRQYIGEVTRRDAVVAHRAKLVPLEVVGNTSEGEVRTIYRSCINTAGNHSSGHIVVILIDPVTRMELSDVCVIYYLEYSGVLPVDYRSRSTSSRIY